jgi:hypothetical protein
VVTALSDGRYEETGPSHGGFRFYNDGPSAAIRTDDGYMIVLTTNAAGSSSLQQFRSLGIEPTAMKIIVAKGVHSPRPAMEPIAREMIWVATPGVTTAANDSGLAIIDELQGLRQELSDLRAEQMTASAAIASGTGKTARILERVAPDGDAIAVRTAA